MIPSWSSSRSESLETTIGGFFLGFLAGGFGSVLRFGEGCCSSSDSDSVLCSVFRAGLFLAVGGPTRGVLPLFLRCVALRLRLRLQKLLGDVLLPFVVPMSEIFCLLMDGHTTG